MTSSCCDTDLCDQSVIFFALSVQIRFGRSKVYRKLPAYVFFNMCITTGCATKIAYDKLNVDTGILKICVRVFYRLIISVFYRLIISVFLYL